MNRFLIILVMLSLLVALPEEQAVGRYQIETITYVSKKGIVYVVETVLDTKTGDVIKRRKIKASKYKLPYKDRYGKLITKE